MSTTGPDDAPDLPEELDGLPDDRADSPPATEEPEDPYAHGPLVQA
jgi:hypothetical protein